MTLFPAQPDSTDAEVAGQPGFVFFLFLVLLQLTVAAALQLADAPFGLLFSEIFLFAGPAVLWCLGTNFRPRAFLKLQPTTPSLLLLGVAIGVANFMASGALQVLTRAVLPESLTRQIDLTRLFDVSGPELALLLLAISVFAPLGEEIAFRGYLQTVFRARWPAAKAIAVTAVLFAALHLEAVGFVARVELGIVFGFLVLWSRSLLPSMAAHATNNLIVTGLFLASRNAPDAEAQPPLGPTLLWGAGAAALTGLLLGAFRSLAARAPVPAAAPLARVEGAGHLFVAQRAARGGVLWLAGALLSIGLFVALDGRAALVSYVDLTAPAASLEAKAQTPQVRDRLRRDLRDARQLARRGELPLARYEQLLSGLAQRASDGTLSGDEVDAAFALAGVPASDSGAAAATPDAGEAPDAGGAPGAAPGAAQP